MFYRILDASFDMEIKSDEPANRDNICVAFLITVMRIVD